MNLTATVTVVMAGISLRFLNTIHLKIYQRLAKSYEPPHLNAAIYEEKSYLGVYRVHDCRGSGFNGKRIVIGLLGRSGMLYTGKITDSANIKLEGVIRDEIDLHR